ncbi:MAG: prepilin peptidase [Chloroflexi bacterium]|nr:prepilin peptidase [Chloroflexota bacterium]
MTLALMALAGLALGFVLDAVIAKLAREPYEHPEQDEDGDAPVIPGGLKLASEHGALDLPGLLDGRSLYRTAAVVVATTVLFAVVGAQYEGNALHLAIVAGYVSALVVCASTDVLAFRVPNVITYPGIVAALVIGMTLPDANRLDVIVGSLLFGGMLMIPSLLARGMGMGDVKLAFFVGLVLGLGLVVPAMLYLAFGVGIAAVVLLVTRIRNRRDPIPYAPFIAGGALIVILTQGVAFADL